MKISLSEKDYEFLKSIIDPKSLILKTPENYIGDVENDKQLEIIINDNIAEILLDKLSNLLIEKGLNKNDEPNQFGIYIESLIDKVSREYYK
jgi:hypothetical protein